VSIEVLELEAQLAAAEKQLKALQEEGEA